MITPTHDEISLQAKQLWRNRGCPAGSDTEIWLEAERALTGGPAVDTRGSAETTAAGEVEYHLSPAQTEQKSIRTEMLKEGARAPQVPHHTGPKTKPCESGKPLWPRPHSS